jgi:hypothetical protein
MVVLGGLGFIWPGFIPDPLRGLAFIGAAIFLAWPRGKREA